MKLWLKCALFAIAISLVLAPLRYPEVGFGITGTSLVGFPVFFLLSYFCLKKYSEKTTVWEIFGGLVLGELALFPNTIYHFFGGQLWFLPQLLIQTLAIVCGYLYWKLRPPINAIPPLIGFALTVLMFFQGYNYWLHYLNYGTFTGKIDKYKLGITVDGVDRNNTQISNRNFENKIVLLDFWHTRCAICFEKFPQVQALYDKYKNSDSIVIFAVNKPLEEDAGKSAFQVIAEDNYSFPVLLPTDENLPEKFGVTGYPTTFVIDRTGNVVYKGGIEGAIEAVEYLNKQ